MTCICCTFHVMQGYNNIILISYHCRTLLVRTILGLAIKRSMTTIGYILTLVVKIKFGLLNDVTNLRHNAVATSASSNIIVIVLHLLESLYAFKVFQWCLINRRTCKCLLISSLSGLNRNTSDWLGKPRSSYAVTGIAS